jgi:serine/threonine protein kinase
MYNSTSNKLSDQLMITQSKLGNGAFGCVYVAKSDGKDVAVKCESKNSPVITLLREFKICRKVYMVKKYLKYLEYYNNNSTEQTEKEKIKNILSNLELNPIIKVYNYLSQNDMLLIPNQLSMNYILKTRCIPETFSYIECNDFNFLTMELCGDNFESIMEKFKFTDRAKYFIAHRLLHIMSCIHRCGIIHRDIKLSNFVLDKKIDFDRKIDSEQSEIIKTLYPLIIDMGLGKEYYKYEPDKVLPIPQVNTKSITGTLRYISLNVHEFKSPTIVDDLISLSYALIVIFTNKNLPWVGHKKDADKFDNTKHNFDNCPCGYHQNKINNCTKSLNTIAEMKFHTPLDELVPTKYSFLIKWIKYLYSLKPKQLPSYNYLFKCLLEESKAFDSLYLEIKKKT